MYINLPTSAVACSCTHLTEFAILYDLRQDESGQSTGISSLIANNPMYLVFAALYILVGSVAMTQLARSVRYIGCTNWLLTLEHILVSALAIIRAINMILYYNLSSSISFTVLALFSALSPLLVNWIFSLVIFAWAGIYHAAMDGGSGSRSGHPFSRYKTQFVVLNTIVTIAVGALFGVLLTTNDATQMEQYAEAGGLLTASLGLLTSIFFLLYGTLLVRQLTKDFASAHAKNLFFVALSFSIAFLISCTITYISALSSSFYIF